MMQLTLAVSRTNPALVAAATAAAVSEYNRQQALAGGAQLPPLPSTGAGGAAVDAVELERLRSRHPVAVAAAVELAVSAVRARVSAIGW